jgi:hypothetical protein
VEVKFMDFMKISWLNYLDKGWEEITRREPVLIMTKENGSFDPFGSSSLSNFEPKTQRFTIPPREYYQSKELLRRKIRWMTDKLAIRCRGENMSKEERFEDWLADKQAGECGFRAVMSSRLMTAAKTLNLQHVLSSTLWQWRLFEMPPFLRVSFPRYNTSFGFGRTRIRALSAHN